MQPPPLLVLPDKYQYEKYFIQNYCKNKIITYDNIHVRFNKNNFYHSFFEKNKSTFSMRRAERMNWIKEALLNSYAEEYIGWNNAKKKLDPYRRVSVNWNNYTVIIELKKNKQLNEAAFITAFCAEYRTLELIKQSPKWKMPLVL